LTGEIGSSSNPISGMTIATLLLTCVIFFVVGRTGHAAMLTALMVAAVVCIASSNGGTTSQDLKTGYLIGATPSRQQIAILVGSLSSALVLGFVILKLNDAGTVFAARNYPDVTFSQSDYTGTREHLRGADADRDHAEYNVVWLKEPRGNVPTGKYLVDDGGHIKYLEDPGINGKLDTRDNGEKVKAKFSAPKPVLMSFIIEGIMTQRLPWGLVLLGVFISVVLELCGMSSLAFAVGVYLPLSSSSPIFIGGMVRWLVDKYVAKKFAGQNLTEEQLTAEGDKSPGVLMASGYIAGGAIAGIVIAFSQGLLTDFDTRITKTMEAVNPFFNGDWSNVLALVPFGILTVLLYLAGREAILANRSAR
jgi:uncharacterized oligopeptide transporter (OPT) family protein